jgi:hypothetical protein
MSDSFRARAYSRCDLDQKTGRPAHVAIHKPQGFLRRSCILSFFDPNICVAADVPDVHNHFFPYVARIKMESESLHPSAERNFLTET